ncbi:hypothetical protein [Bradyrhizobium sp. 33ap4]|uniref:hypothetical protein n=1 Tax=Bradyrhizobium sp. 33ap4 TaxID=3061630 RepID=UPI00292EDBC8|nr:hypothetical protein [Bradyrhizobium sp. 33ap4]
MVDLLVELEELRAVGKFYGFSIWRAQNGYQASLGVAHNSFRIRVADTIEQAVDELFNGRGPLELPRGDVRAAREVFEPEPPTDSSVFD